MNHSELKELIREEVVKVLSEAKDTIHTSVDGGKTIKTSFPIRITPLTNFDETQVSFGFGNDSTWKITLDGVDVRENYVKAVIKKAFMAFEKEIANMGKIEKFK